MTKLFEKGKSGNPKGKIKGTRNKKTIEIQEAARRLVEAPDYVVSLKKRLREGRAPHMETLLFHYAYGKPKEHIEHSGALNIKLLWKDYVTNADTQDATD